MWPDNETDLDFLNFTGVADTVAEIIVQAQPNPISIVVSGAWGVGKSSMDQVDSAITRWPAEHGFYLRLHTRGNTKLGNLLAAAASTP